MSLVESASWRGTLHTLWPTRSRAGVVFYWREAREVEQIAERLFGRVLRRWEYAGLAGAPDEARVEVSVYRDGLYLDMDDPAAGRYRAIRLVQRAAGELLMVNDGFHIHARNMQRKGLGLLVFHRQLSNARFLGIRFIKAVAGRRHNENGYYTWPRFGFDGPLPESIRANLPPGLEHARTVLELIDREKGRRWWREHGETIHVTFDVTDQSRSRKVFERYVRHRLRRSFNRTSST